ncbi:MAG: porin [Pseudomonadota bacterium]
MKKVLLTSTALVMSAGMAAAEVGVSGFAELGFFEIDEPAGRGEWELHTDIDVTFTLSGATDNGLVFGASIDLDESDGSGGCDFDNLILDTIVCEVSGNSPAFDNDTQGGESIFVSGNFGTLTMGDTDGALDWAMQEAIIGASIIDDNEHGGYNGNSFFDSVGDGQIARYEYSFGDFSAAVSYAQINNGLTDEILGDDIWGIGATYASDFGTGVNWRFGLGYQECSGCEAYGASIGARLDSGFEAIINFSNSEVDGALGALGTDTDHYGIALGYRFDAWTFAVNYGEFDFQNSDITIDGYSLIVNYDLGGGAEAQFGYGSTSTDTPAGLPQVDDIDTYSLGLALNF